jgi:hypothetical protein
MPPGGKKPRRELSIADAAIHWRILILPKAKMRALATTKTNFGEHRCIRRILDFAHPEAATTEITENSLNRQFPFGTRRNCPYNPCSQ